MPEKLTKEIEALADRPLDEQVRGYLDLANDTLNLAAGTHDRKLRSEYLNLAASLNARVAALRQQQAQATKT